MISITSNPAQKLAFGVASATTTFTTDATAPVQTTANIAAGQGYLTLASSAGMLAGDFLAAETGNTAGTGPWVSTILGAITATNVNTSVPSSRVALSNGVITRFERIETRYKAKKVTLTNLTNGDVFVWDTTLNDNQAYKTSGGVTTTISDAILNRSNCIALHPNILPASSSFSMKSDYDYREAAVDTTAPILTSPSGTATGPTTATGSVTTDEAGGTLYYLVNTSATATAAQVKAGASKAVTAAGAQSVSLTGLTASTVYYLHFLHADSAATPNESAVANSASFTTQASQAGDTTAPTLSAATAAPNGAYAATGSVTTDEGNGTLYYLASTSTSLTAAQVKAGATLAISSAGAKSVAVSGLAAATIYYLYFLHTDAAGNQATTPTRSASFTTAAAPTNPATIDATKVPASRTVIFPGNKRVVTF